MKKILIFVLTCTFLMGVFAAGQGARGSEYDQGKKLYSEKCYLCHGHKGDGNGPGAVAFSPRPANFTDPKFWQKFNDEMISETVRKGHGMMPAFDLSADQIKAIIDYLKAAFKK